MSQVTVNGMSTNWLIAPETKLLVQKCLLGGSIDKLQETCPFKVNRPTTFPVGQPVSVMDGFELGAEMTGIERVVPGSTLRDKFNFNIQSK